MPVRPCLVETRSDWLFRVRPGEDRLRISAPSVIGVRNQRSVFGRQRGQPNESIGVALNELSIFLDAKVVSEQDGR